MRYWPPLLAKEKATCSLPNFEYKHQLNIHAAESFKSGNESEPWSLYCIMIALAAWIHNNASYDTPPISYKWALMERQWFMVLEVRSFKSDLVIVRYNQRIGHLYRANRKRHALGPILKMSPNSVSTICSLPSWLTKVGSGRCCLYTMYWLISLAEELMNTKLER